MYKIIFTCTIYLLLLLKLLNTQNVCGVDEVTFRDVCYGLVEFKKLIENSNKELLFKMASCENILNETSRNDQTDLKMCLESLKEAIKLLTRIYIHNSKLDTFYEFGYLNKQTYKKIFHNLVEVDFNYRKNSFHHNLKTIFLNAFLFNNNHYIENQPNDGTQPNLMIHDDKNMSALTDKCIYGHLNQNQSESFGFYVGDCNRKFPFICIKPYRLSIDVSDQQTNDRCSHFNTHEPGGNWFECDRLTRVFDQDFDDLKLSESQKCCMYNVEWKENFYDANNLCKQFNSHVFSLKIKGYKNILETYANYLSVNYDDSNSDFVYFWTSCKLRAKKLNVLSSFEPECLSVTPDFDSTDDSSSKDTAGFEISGVNITTYENILLNLTFITRFLNEMQHNIETNSDISLKTSNSRLVYVKNIFLQLYNAVLLGRRKLVPFLFQTRLEDKYTKKVYNQSIDLSLPFLNRFYHFSLVNITGFTEINSSLLLENFTFTNKALPLINPSLNLVSSLLNVLGIIKMVRCRADEPIGSSFVITNFYANEQICFKITHFIKEETYMTKTLTTSNYLIVLHSYSFVHKILYLNCQTTATESTNVLQECLQYYNYEFCRVKCPKNCDLDRHNVWQSTEAQFVYWEISSVCQAGYHSNSLNYDTYETTLYIGNKLPVSNNRVMFNNGIFSNIWPFEQNIKIKSKLEFYFKNSSFNPMENFRKSKETLLMVKSAYFLNESQLAVNILCSVRFTYNLRGLVGHYSSQKNEYLKKAFLKNVFTLTWNISDEQKNLNNYYDLNINENNQPESVSIKFPINFLDKNNNLQVFPDKHTARQGVDTTLNTIKNNNRSACFWYFMNLNSSIECSSSLNLTSNSLQINDNDKQLLIAYPRSSSLNSKLFSRILFGNNSNMARNRCEHGGIQIEFSKCLCFPGFMGNYCEKICEKNSFGPNCEHSCPNNDCNGYLICTTDPIGCSCASGFTGFMCNQQCSANTWGPNCQNKCKNCEKCDRFSGNCKCKNSNIIGRYCEKCVSGFFGNDCSSKCESNCVQCNKTNGACIDSKKSQNHTKCSDELTTLKLTCIYNSSNADSTICEFYKNKPVLDSLIDLKKFNISVLLAQYTEQSSLNDIEIKININQTESNRSIEATILHIDFFIVGSIRNEQDLLSILKNRILIKNSSFIRLETSCNDCHNIRCFVQNKICNSDKRPIENPEALDFNAYIFLNCTKLSSELICKLFQCVTNPPGLYVKKINLVNETIKQQAIISYMWLFTLVFILFITLFFKIGLRNTTKGKFYQEIKLNNYFE